MAELSDLLRAAASEADQAAAPGDRFYVMAGLRLRRHRVTRGVAGGVAAGVVAIAGAGVAGGWLPGSALRGGVGPGVAAGQSSNASLACVKDLLAQVHGRVERDGMAVVVVDIPAQQDHMTQGITGGSGWEAVRRVAVVAPGPVSVTPPETFRMWSAVKETFDPAAGRHVLLVNLDNSPRVPGGTYGDPVWYFDSFLHFPVEGDDMVVTCASGEKALVPWVGATSPGGWLAQGAAIDSPSTGPLPSGAASTDRPTPGDATSTAGATSTGGATATAMTVVADMFSGVPNPSWEPAPGSAESEQVAACLAVATVTSDVTDPPGTLGFREFVVTNLPTSSANMEVLFVGPTATTTGTGGDRRVVVSGCSGLYGALRDAAAKHLTADQLSAIPPAG